MNPKSILLPTLSACVVLLAGSTRLEGQAQAPGGHEHSPAAAGIIEWFVPTAGYAYGGDWTAGFVSNGVRIGAYATLLATYDEAEERCEGVCSASALVALGATVWAIVGAVSTANEHNRALGAVDSGFVVAPSADGGLSLGFRVAR